MGYFMQIARNPKKFIIPHQKLYEYGVITNPNDSYYIKQCLKFMAPDVDYIVFPNVRENLSGGRPTNQYMLTQDTFKNCLGRAKNTRIYMDYFVRLEKVFSSYKDYRTMHNQQTIRGKNDEIGRLERMTAISCE